VFYATIGFLLRADVSLVAEFSFRRGLSEPDLRPLTEIARTVNVHCDTSIEEAQRRFTERERTQRRVIIEGMRRHRPDSLLQYGASQIIRQMEAPSIGRYSTPWISTCHGCGWTRLETMCRASTESWRSSNLRRRPAK
jgi:hypothetical protein